MSKNLHRLICVVATVFVLVGCKSSSESGTTKFDESSSWVLMPLVNESESLTADQSATELVEHHLRRRGVNPILSTSGLAKNSSPNHVVTGRIVDWKYNNLTRSRANVKISLHVYDVKTQELLWRKEQSKTGGSGDSIVNVADELLARLVSEIDLSARVAESDIKDDSTVNAAVSQLASQMIATNELGDTSGKLVNGAPGDVEIAAALPKTQQVPSQFAPGGSIALYYGVNPPVSMLNEFDRVVLESDAITSNELSEFNTNADVNTTLFAYLSVGEVGPSRQWRASLDESWVLGVNENWASEVMDLSNPGWRAFLMRRADELIGRGFNGFFLDTMDSYQLVAKTVDEKQRQQQGLTTFIASLKAKYPSLQLIANRGFELLPSIATHLDVIAAESLYARWHGTGGYQPVPENDRTWLLGQLNSARQKYGLEALSIDYVEPGNREKAREVAAQIANHGIIPWVSTPSLDQIGVGLEEVFPREVLLIFDSILDWELEHSLVHRLIAMPLEYYGYVPKYIDLAKQSLPKGNLSGRYAGIVNWTEEAYTNAEWVPWLLRQKESGVPLLLLGNLGGDAALELYEELGLRSVNVTGGRIEINTRTSLIGYEREPISRIDYLASPVRSIDSDHQVQLSFKDESGSVIDAVGIAPWGGYAVTAGLIDVDPNQSLHWVIDPYQFVRSSLRLADIPQPDVTTQTGRRITLAHIDGDGLPSWAEMPGKQLGAEVLYDKIIKPYKLPHTISVVEREMTDPLYADRKNRMFELMKNIFRQDNVQIATHTYSHPFKWKRISGTSPEGKYNLKIPGYRFSFEREIDGSIEFINRELAPPGKKVEVVLWSGDALPTEDPISRVKALGLQNLNGGLTTITKARNQLSRVSPMMRPSGSYDQIYAPIMNENVYTNDWTGPFDGFRRVIETLEITDKPRRLKPINIYYHFYSGTKISSMRAMKEVYEWTVNQDIAPMFVGSYSKRVGEFREAQVSRSIDGFWTVSGLEETQSIRWLDAPSNIDMGSSMGVAGQRKLQDGLYIHPVSDGPVRFRPGEDLQQVPELVSSNGQISSWNRNGRSLTFRIQSTMPVEVTLKNTSGCRLRGANASATAKNTSSGQNFTFTQKDTGNVSLECPA